MNDLRSKYLWQVGHYVSTNIEDVDERFLRTLEEYAGIKEEDVAYWRHAIHKEFLDGHSRTLDKRMGYILADVGCIN